MYNHVLLNIFDVFSKWPSLILFPAHKLSWSIKNRQIFVCLLQNHYLLFQALSIYIIVFVPSTLEKVSVTAPGQEVEGQGDGVVGYVPDTDLEALASCVDEITRVYTLADSLIVSPCSNSTCSPYPYSVPNCADSLIVSPCSNSTCSS